MEIDTDIAQSPVQLEIDGDCKELPVAQAPKLPQNILGPLTVYFILGLTAGLCELYVRYVGGLL